MLRNALIIGGLLLANLTSQAATIGTLRDRIDNWLATHWPAFTNRQETYLANKGKYWQGLITHTILPTHTTAADVDTAPNRLAVHPTDQEEDWTTILNEINTTVPAALVCDVYDGPLGKGYVAAIFVIHNGTIYSRARNVGPETWRTYAWRVVDPSELGL